MGNCAIQCTIVQVLALLVRLLVKLLVRAATGTFYSTDGRVRMGVNLSIADFSSL